MTPVELEDFLEQHQHIEYSNDKDNYYFRNVGLPYYKNNPENCTAVTREKMNSITPSELLTEINRGVQVEQITRITGYFTKVSSWNPGKLGELKDRVHCDGNFQSIAKPG